MAGATVVTWRTAAALAVVATAVFAGSAPQAAAQDVPFADTEDATLGSVSVKAERGIHPILTVDLRNGDYARGNLDDDAASLDRVPVHLSLGFSAALSPTLFVIGQSSNGFHAPRADETTRPRSWYESNNLIGLAWRPAEGLTTAALYTIKTSPNDVADTSHEASLSLLYARDSGLGRLQPRLAVTVRPKGNDGAYTIAGVSPDVALGGEDGPSLSLPVSLGIGWGGFYAPGSGDRLFGSAGLSLSQPIAIGGATASLSAELLALVRDDRLARLDAGKGTTATVVPLGTIALRMAW